ncbi:pyridoxamine 5'-phosphate oxidase family protein [Methanofollis sp. UBA420]|uniref:pyridoxamine 5'-phosphate oxidase family protein n=1 Tax=Methanofollis sp. UBA420 TaxID=1915514 RepID=UPI00316AC94A
MSTRLMDYFNRTPRIGVLGTASKDGKVNVAVFESPQMIDEKTVVVALGQNRTLANLQENPNAVYMIVKPAETGVEEWKGIRVSMRMKECTTSGARLDAYRKEIAQIAGDEVAATIQATATFEIGEVRPIVDMGQGWENSI